jgi:predicted nuclease of predicted toxin-antitoxin system
MHVCDVGLNGALDEVIFRWAQEQRAIVLTFDGDFADARMYPVGSHAGVIRLRVWPTTIERTEEALTRLLDSTIDDHLQGSLVIVDDRRIRVRRAARHG